MSNMSQDDIDRLLRGETIENDSSGESGKETTGSQLSQDEIDAMLRSGSSTEEKSQIEIMREEKEKNTTEILSRQEKDAIGEVANISFGSASTTLSSILNHPVSITTPYVEIVNAEEAENDELPHVVLNVDYVKGLDISNLLVIKKQVALVIADLMMMGNGEVPEDKELTELELSAVQEAMNQMMGTAATSMSEVFQKLVDISPPKIKIIETKEEVERLAADSTTNKVIKISFDLEVGNFIKSKLVQILTVENAKEMANDLLKIMNPNGEKTGDLDEKLTEEEKKALGEVVSHLFSNGSTALNAILGKVVKISNPIIQTTSLNTDVSCNFPQVLINIDYSNPLFVESLIAIKKETTMILADLMMMGTGIIDKDKELTDMDLSAVQELFNQMMGSALMSLSQTFDVALEIAPPSTKLSDIKTEALKMSEITTDVVKITLDFEIEGIAQTNILKVLSVPNAKKIARILLDKNKPEDKSTESGIEADSSDGNGQNGSNGGSSEVRKLIKDVEVKIEVIFGSTAMTLKDILSLEQGHIVELDEEMEEDLGIYANGVLVAQGEIVNVDGYFGVKIKKTI